MSIKNFLELLQSFIYNGYMDIRILLIEKSNFFGRAIKHRLETDLDSQVIWYRETEEFLSASHDLSKIDMVIVDYKVDSVSCTTVLNRSHQFNIPIILLADHITHDLQERIWSLKVIDYILKGYNHSVDSITDICKRYFNNHNTGILIVDKSSESRLHLRQLLEMHRYKIYEADNISQTLEVLNANFERIQMVITDHTEPDLDGLELTINVRKNYSMDRISIIGISSQGNHALKVQFIKSGANDFLSKPFISELLYCRIVQNLKVVEYFQQIKDMAIIDQLTRLNNRHFLKETGTLIFENAKRHSLSLITAMIDIDNFKMVNDTYGHDAGDIVLKEISVMLKEFVRKSDLVVRYGGEEFLILGNNLDKEYAERFFNDLRTTIEKKRIKIARKTISITVSIGLCIEMRENLEKQINQADKKLYEAKTTGKNKVCL